MNFLIKYMKYCALTLVFVTNSSFLFAYLPLSHRAPALSLEKVPSGMYFLTRIITDWPGETAYRTAIIPFKDFDNYKFGKPDFIYPDLLWKLINAEKYIFTPSHILGVGKDVQVQVGGKFYNISLNKFSSSVRIDFDDIKFINSNEINRAIENLKSVKDGMYVLVLASGSPSDWTSKGPLEFWQYAKESKDEKAGLVLKLNGWEDKKEDKWVAILPLNNSIEPEKLAEYFIYPYDFWKLIDKNKKKYIQTKGTYDSANKKVLFEKIQYPFPSDPSLNWIKFIGFKLIGSDKLNEALKAEIKK